MIPWSSAQLRNVWIHKAWGSLVEMCPDMCPIARSARLWYVGVNQSSWYGVSVLFPITVPCLVEFVVDFFGFLRGKLLFSALDLAVGCLLLQNQCGSLRCRDGFGWRTYS